jgi:hypothetical protein
VTVEQRETGLVGGEVDLHGLVAPEHHDVLHDAGDRLPSVAGHSSNVWRFR